MNHPSQPPTLEDEEDLSAIVSTRTQAPAARVAPEGEPDGLPPPLAAVVRGIGEEAPRQFVGGLFADTLRLLGQVGRLRDAVAEGGTRPGVGNVLAALKKSSSYLLTNIETAELRVDGLPAPLTEALEAAAFALRHELRRVFETELAGAADRGPETRDVLRACALLENCFQQLTICLARTFEPGLKGAELFESYRRRREQSFALRAELKALLMATRAAEREFGVLTSLALINRVNRFRRESLHHLSYRDWEDFERFADAMELSYESDEVAGPLLHKFSCYIEALLSQVEMRGVLADG